MVPIRSLFYSHLKLIIYIQTAHYLAHYNELGKLISIILGSGCTDSMGSSSTFHDSRTGQSFMGEKLMSGREERS